MEIAAKQSKEDEEQIELPPGFRFHPTDEELITHYLSPKIVDNCFCSIAIGEVDLNKCEPWDLPWRAKMGEKHWYFFCVRDRKYPTGLRTNRATDAGYWKATGKDKEIYKMKNLIGMKKTLVFYRGRAPKGEKTNWVMHEYRLEGKFSIYNLPKSAKTEWVICRVFQKTSSGKKPLFPGLMSLNSYEEKFGPTHLPPLKDSSPYNDNVVSNIGGDLSHVSCLSNTMEKQNAQNQLPDTFKTPISHQNSLFTSQFAQNIESLQHPDSNMIQDQSILRFLIQNQGLNMKQSPKTEFVQETGMCSSAMNNQRPMDDHESAPCIDIDSFWNY